MASEDPLAPARSKLERLEDTICRLLAERMEFKLDKVIYEVGGVREVGGVPMPQDVSFFEDFFRDLERVYAKRGRYAHPEERPFFIKPTTPDGIRIMPVTNLTGKILPAYMALLPKLGLEGDDNERGSPAEVDIACLQALSRRVHIGEQVAEIKYQDPLNQPAYDELIRKGDREGILQKLTVPKVEALNLERIGKKSARYQVPGETICAFFEDYVMPLTKEVEVIYLLAKGTTSPANVFPLRPSSQSSLSLQHPARTS